MIVILCLDENRGMLFNKRRQSRDREVIKRIMEICLYTKLRIHPFSVMLFKEELSEVIVAEEEFLQKAEKGEYCFVENQDLKEVEEKIEKLVIFWWNRSYPADFRFTLDLKSWKKVAEEEFVGYSHDRITKEVYEK